MTAETWAPVAGSAWGLAAGLFVVAAFAGLVEGALNRPTLIAFALSALGGIAVTVLGVALLATAGPLSFRLGDVLGFAPVELAADRLSAVFLVAFGPVAVAASVFAVGYGRAEAAHGHRPGAATGAAYPFFLLCLLLVFTAGAAFSFLLGWEGMALASAVLVFGRQPDREERAAGLVYLALTHLATAAIVVTFAWLTGLAGGATAFGAWAGPFAAAGPTIRGLVIVLAIAGFGTKAGAMPLHIWLPRAHPVAPSPVSALMSGVMLKAGIYGLVRIAVYVAGPGDAWWGGLLLVLGGTSAVLGILYAVMERDLKRLLAFSSIENIGIVLLGVGASIVLRAADATELAGLALGGALLHVIVHAWVKGALFLGAGAVQTAAGTRDLDRLGGLAKAMPVTAAAFGLGAAALAGLPPLAGFASEWLTFQGLLGLAGTPAAGELPRILAVAGIAALALTAALAVAALVMATGMTFLALPRSGEAGTAREVGPSMRFGPGLLGLLVVGLSLAAGPVSTLLGEIAARPGLHPGYSRFSPSLPEVTLGPSQTAPAAVAPALLAAALVALTVAGLAALAAGGALGRAKRVPTWTGGIAPTAAMEYTATSYAKPLRLFFGGILRPAREVRIDVHPGTPFPRTISYRSEITLFIDQHLLAPIHLLAVRGAQLTRRLQGGSLQLYVGYVVVALVALLVFAR